MTGKILIKIVLLSFSLSTSTQLLAKKVPVIVFERTPCLGNCQTYKLSIFKNRKMALNAGPFTVVKEGEYKARLKKKEYKELIQLFQESDFFKLDKQHTSVATDLPSQYLTFSTGDESRTILDYDHTNPSLIKLEDFLQQVVEKAKWKKSN
jgi:hypothetical protein